MGNELSGEMEALRDEVVDALAEIDRLKAKLARFTQTRDALRINFPQFYCPDCETDTIHADEDGCCATCGCDLIEPISGREACHTKAALAQALDRLRGMEAVLEPVAATCGACDACAVTESRREDSVGCLAHRALDAGREGENASLEPLARKDDQ